MAHIFIIDDSPTDVRVFTTLLEKAGHRVSSAVNAEEGISGVKRELPDLVIMDVIMPGMNGFQATRDLSRDSQTGHIPILIVTTMRQGAKDFLTKPVDAKALLQRIDTLLPG